MLSKIFDAFSRAVNKNQSKDNQSVENIILKNINQKIREFEKHISKIENLNVQEMLSNKNPTEEQIKELEEVIASLNLLLDIFLEIKNYIAEYIKEIQSNKYLMPEQKREIIASLRNSLHEVRKRIERAFMEIEFFAEKLNFL